MNPKKPKVWCEHIQWIEGCIADTECGRLINNNYWCVKVGDYEVPRSWKLCPICGKRRPRR